MKDNIFNFYIFGVITNLVLVLSYIKLTTRRYSGHFRENLRKISIRVDFYGNIDADFMRFASSCFYVLLNILMSWVFLPFNFIILFIRIYSLVGEVEGEEIKLLNLRLKNSLELIPEHIFVLFQLCDKSIIPNIFCKAEIMDNLKQHNRIKNMELCPVKVEEHLDELIKRD
ncbi:MAG: hypothetical protein BM556_02380 [Bacteriovorax sp. MedPE-SWde]|nr:MAG: hypothetical protein BM556_02380 [Bacteriovorax sp. MedPE-SWde]